MTRIPQSVVSALMGHARREYPRECCGILIGRHVDDEARVERAVEAENIAENDRRKSYQIDWRTLLATTRSVRATREQIVGFYHSHPDGSSRPSRSDRQEAWLDHTYVILSMRDGLCTAVSGWRVHSSDNDFDSEPLVIEPDEDRPRL
ncbi:MAG: M67 family metallopeptidase [Planctomycetes bacterium]|nr:M67 family metallopeptidase [Planctomycetota bacterium]